MATRGVLGGIPDVRVNPNLTRFPIRLYEKVFDPHRGSRQEFNGLHDASKVVNQPVSERYSLVLVRSLRQHHFINGFVGRVQHAHCKPVAQLGLYGIGYVEDKRRFSSLMCSNMNSVHPYIG